MRASDATRALGRLAVPAASIAVAALARSRLGEVRLGDALQVLRDTDDRAVILTLDLTRSLRPESSGLAALRSRGRPTLTEVIDTVTWAADDPRVVALLARVGGDLGGLATVQEVAAAVRRFVDSGKTAVAHADVFGEAGNGTLAYLLATAFGEVHLQPGSEIALLGVSGEVTFLRGALDRVGIDPQFDHRHEYKNAADALTEYGFTDAHREALDALVDDWASQIVTAIAAARNLDAGDVRDAIDTAPLTASEAEDRRLVDRLAYLDETLDEVRRRVPDDAHLVPLDRYLGPVRARQRWRTRAAPLVGLVDASGPVTVRDGGGFGGPRASSDRLCADLRRAAEDDDVAAVVLRIDSPGGSAVASDAIRREVRRTRERGTPVVAWMGDVAGSGGYYIAMGADHIVAQAGTLTGSIGVVSGKAVRSGLEHRLGVRTDAITRGAHARYYSSAAPFTDSERARLDRQLDSVYEDFTAKVAHDRGLDAAHVHRVARGRIWTGAQAQTHGLIDRLGGRREVLDAVRRTLALDPDAVLRVRRHPAPSSVVARLRGHAPPDPAERDVDAVLAAVSGDIDTWVALLDRTLRLPGSLAMPWVPRIR